MVSTRYFRALQKVTIMRIKLKLSSRIFLSVMGVAFIVILTTIALVNSQFRGASQVTINTQSESSIDILKARFDNTILAEEEKIEQMARIVESTLMLADFESSQQYLTKVMLAAVETNRNWAYVWLSLKNSFAMPTADPGRVQIQAEYTAMGARPRTSNIPEDRDNFSLPYFVCLDSAKIMLSEPEYVSFDGLAQRKVLKSSLMYPLRDNSGDLIGVFGIDIKLDTLQGLATELGRKTDISLMLMSANDKVITHTNSSKVDLNIKDAESALHKTLSKFNTNDTAFVLYDQNGEDSVYCSVRSVDLHGLCADWRVVSTAKVQAVDRIASSSKAGLTKILCIGFLVLIGVVFLYTISLITSIGKVSNTIEIMSTGQVDNQLHIKTLGVDVLGQMVDSTNKVLDGMLQVTKFAEEIGNGNFNYKFEPLSKSDALGNSIVGMRDSLQLAQKEEDDRRIEEEHLNWASSGVNIFNRVMRQDNLNLKTLSIAIVENLVNYLGAQMGGFYILSEDKQSLELTAQLGFSNEKLSKKEIAPGDGLVGRTLLEKETIFISDIPADTAKIGSGLGTSLPKSAMSVPLINNKELTGVIELYSFKMFEPYQIQFVEKIAETVASNIVTVRANATTKELLEESERNANDIKQQESVLTQNMQEMRMKQEEDDIKQGAMSNTIDCLRNSMPMIEYSIDGKITKVNKKFVDLVKTRSDKFVGKYDFGRNYLNEKQQDEHDRFWISLRQGNVMQLDEEYAVGDEKVYVHKMYVPITNDNGIDSVVAVCYDNTELKQLEAKLEAIQNGEFETNDTQKPEFISLNIDKIREAYQDDEKISAVLSKYRTQITEELEALTVALHDGDMKEVKTQAKLIRTKMENMGETAVSGKMSDILAAIADGNTDNISVIFESAKVRWSLVASEMAKLIM